MCPSPRIPPSVTVLFKERLRILRRKAIDIYVQLVAQISTPELYNMKVILLSNFLSLKRENPGS